MLTHGVAKNMKSVWEETEGNVNSLELLGGKARYKYNVVFTDHREREINMHKVRKAGSILELEHYDVPIFYSKKALSPKTKSFANSDKQTYSEHMPYSLCKDFTFCI